MSFEDRLRDCGASIQSGFNASLATFDQSESVVQAMVHATNGGKRLRGFFVLEGARLHGIDDSVALPVALSIEAIHAYSLVHDDLPAMDDDDMRRGQPTVHRKWDEATAILAGDALQSFAFSQLASTDVSPDRVVDLVATLARAAGAGGMVLGQALDISAESSDQALTLEQITRLQKGKTGALLEWSTTAGPRLAGADTKPLAIYGRAIGLAFQIADDILDVIGDETKAGKRLQKDEGAGKATFVSLLGLEEAQLKARALVAEAEEALCTYDARADNLRAAARFVISREF